MGRWVDSGVVQKVGHERWACESGASSARPSGASSAQVVTPRATRCGRSWSPSAATCGSRTGTVSARSGSTARHCGCAVPSSWRTSTGNTLCRIQTRMLHIRDTMVVEKPDGSKLATVHKALITPLRERWKVDVEDGDDIDVKGNIVDHEYSLEIDGRKVAEVSKRWFRVQGHLRRPGQRPDQPDPRTRDRRGPGHDDGPAGLDAPRSRHPPWVRPGRGRAVRLGVARPPLRRP